MPSCAWSSDVCRSEEHTSELQSLTNLVCRLLLEKKKMRNIFSLLFAVVNITCFSQGQILYKTDLNSFPWDGDASTGQIKNRGILPLTIEPYSNTPWSKAPYMYFDGHMRGGQNN